MERAFNLEATSVLGSLPITRSLFRDQAIRSSGDHSAGSICWIQRVYCWAISFLFKLAPELVRDDVFFIVDELQDFINGFLECRLAKFRALFERLTASWATAFCAIVVRAMFSSEACTKTDLKVDEAVLQKVVHVVICEG